MSEPQTNPDPQITRLENVPHSVEAEQQVLGEMLLKNCEGPVYPAALANGGAELFHDPVHRRIFDVCHSKALQGFLVSPITVAQIMRDVFDMAPAQRLDLTLDTTNDGKHSYGEGDWLIHDHRERGGFTTNGMAEGGSISSIVYKSYLNGDGLPKVSHFGIDLSKYFTKEYYERRLPIWQDLDETASLGSPAGQVGVDPATQTSLLNALYGLLAGLLLYLIFAKREQIKQCAVAAVSRLKSPKGSNQ